MENVALFAQNKNQHLVFTPKRPPAIEILKAVLFEQFDVSSWNHCLHLTPTSRQQRFLAAL
jgi:hypothetical protein